MQIIVDGLAVEYRDEGEGPVMLMLHGWGNTLHSFDELCRELRGFRMIRMDLPGFGETETPVDAWDVAQYARFVAKFCAKLKIEPKILLGHSLGGRIITKGIATNTLHAKKLILIASAGVADRKTTRNVAYAAAAKVGKALLSPLPKSLYERARHKLYSATGSDYLTDPRMSESFLNMIREDLSDYAKKITVPTLIVWGEWDVVTPLSEGEKLHALIADSQLYTIARATHFVHREYPREVAGRIEAFCV